MNLDPELHEVLAEAHTLSRPPLSVRLPPVVRTLVRSINVRELRDRQRGVVLLAQAYNALCESLSEVDTQLFQHKLQLVENVSGRV